MTISKSFAARARKQSAAPTIEAQAAVWLEKGKTRKRRPFSPATAKKYSSHIETHIKPTLGKMPVDVVGNTILKSFCLHLGELGLSPSSIRDISNVVKEIRGSVKDQDGQEVYPYKWDAETIDAPEIQDPRQPIASAQTVQDALNCPTGSRNQKALWALLAGSGLRIKEALALHIGPGTASQNQSYWHSAENKLVIRRNDTKTDAGEREVDLPTCLNEFLKRTITWGVADHLSGQQHKNSLLFRESESTYRKALIKCGVIGGFHSLRRYRVTHLRMKSIPEPIIHFWIGHEDKSVTDSYTKVGSEIQARKGFAENAGLGFGLPEGI